MTSYVITYRGVKGSPIIDTEYDGTIHNLDDRIVVLEASGLASGIDSFAIDTSGHLIVTMGDSSTLDAGQLPVPSFSSMFIGEWSAGLLLKQDQLFTAEGSLWAVRLDHTADSTFDPGANDGSGHDYYLRVVGYPVAYGYEISDAEFSPTIVHANSYMRFTSATGCAITIDPAVEFPPWTELHFRNESTLGVLSFDVATPGSINLQYGCDNTSNGQGSTVTMKKIGDTDAWDIFGLMAAAGTV